MRGRVAQLGECYIRIVEVEGSNPFVSTKMKGTAKAVLFHFGKYDKKGFEQGRSKAPLPVADKGVLLR